MPTADEPWQTDDLSELIATILRLDDRDTAMRFFRDLCTVGELHDMAQRWAVVRLLDAGHHYADISKRTGASTATITRIASWLNHGEGGYRTALERSPAGSSAPRSAVPSVAGAKATNEPAGRRR